MTLKNSEVVRKFIAGDTSGKANSMEIMSGPIKYNGVKVPEGHTALVGYGWAIYAVRTDSGRVNVHWGWHDWAEEKRQNAGKPGLSTTERHLKLIDDKTGPTAILTERRPQCGPEPGSTREIERDPNSRIAGRL